MNQRIAGAIRFATTIAFVNVTALMIFGSGTATTAASFATISSLYFLDYDGSVRERIGAYSASVLTAMIGLILGIFVQNSLLATVSIAFLIGFCFAVARSFRGLIARSFIGAQLAFVLAVFTSQAGSHGIELIQGWLWGAILSLVAALVIFPRHHSGKVRRALSQWCLAVAEYVESPNTLRPATLSLVERSVKELEESNPGDMVAGLWSRRTRALAAMSLHVRQTTEFLELVPPVLDIDSEQIELSRATAQGFRSAAKMVLLEGTPLAFAPVVQARLQDFEAERRRVAQLGNTKASHGVENRFNLRVLSIAAESVQVLAAASHGWPHPEWPLVVQPEHSITSLLKRTFRTDSVWLFHGLRTGLALAGAIAIASLMGLEHGVWVVMTTLSVINISFTATGTTKTAGQILLGVLGGFCISALIIFTVHEWWLMAILVPLLALWTKWSLPDNAMVAQLTYTPFAVANVALLGWPSPRGLNFVRAEDILIGVAVAVVATLLTFPFGMRKLLEATWLRAQSTAITALEATKNALFDQTPLLPEFAREQAIAFAEAVDAVDAAFSNSGIKGDRARLVLSRQQWLNLAILCQIGVAQLAQHRTELPDSDPGIIVLCEWGNQAFKAIDHARPS